MSFSISISGHKDVNSDQEREEFAKAVIAEAEHFFVSLRSKFELSSIGGSCSTGSLPTVTLGAKNDAEPD